MRTAKLPRRRARTASWTASRSSSSSNDSSAMMASRSASAGRLTPSLLVAGHPQSHDREALARASLDSRSAAAALAAARVYQRLRGLRTKKRGAASQSAPLGETTDSTRGARASSGRARRCGRAGQLSVPSIRIDSSPPVRPTHDIGLSSNQQFRHTCPGDSELTTRRGPQVSQNAPPSRSVLPLDSRFR